MVLHIVVKGEGRFKVLHANSVCSFKSDLVFEIKVDGGKVVGGQKLQISLQCDTVRKLWSVALLELHPTFRMNNDGDQRRHK